MRDSVSNQNLEIIENRWIDALQELDGLAIIPPYIFANFQKHIIHGDESTVFRFISNYINGTYFADMANDIGAMVTTKIPNIINIFEDLNIEKIQGVNLEDIMRLVLNQNNIAIFDSHIENISQYQEKKYDAQKWLRDHGYWT